MRLVTGIVLSILCLLPIGTVTRDAEPVTITLPPAPLDTLAASIPSQYYFIVMRHAIENGIPPVILARLVERESNWNPNAVRRNRNGTKDYGLAQLNSAYLDEYAWRYNEGIVINVFDPEVSVAVGARYLARLYAATDSWYLAVAAYNAGLSRVRSGKIPASTVRHAGWIVGHAAAEGGTY